MTIEIPYTIADYFDVARRRWIYIATILPAVILISVYLAYTLPPLYRASGTLLLEASSIPEDLVRTTVTTFAAEQLDLVWRRVMTGENLAGIIEKVDPYPVLDLSTNAKARLLSQNTSVERVDPITLEPLSESNAFSLHYFNPDPDIAAAVVEQMIEMFLAINREARTEQAGQTREFLQTLSSEVGEKILDLERRLAEFKTQHGDALPEAQGRILNSLDRVERDREGLQRQILLAEERKTLLELQLSQINPNLFDTSGDWRTELAQLRAELAEAQQRYTEDHPTVRRLRRSVEAISARAQVAERDPVTTPDNPDHALVASQLDTVKRELAALRSSASEAQRQIDSYERSVERSPEVEREQRQLTRDYELAQQRFREIERNLDTAAMGQALESEQRGHRLTLVRAPYRPSTPDSPNRLGIILLGLVLGSALSAGVAAMVESTDPTIRGARDLSEITDIKPLGAVPFMLNAAEKRKRVLVWGAASIVFAIAVVFVGSTVAQAAVW